MAREARWVRVARNVTERVPSLSPQRAAAAALGAEFQVGEGWIEPCALVSREVWYEGEKTMAEQFGTVLGWQGLPAGWGESLAQPLKPLRPSATFCNLRWPRSRPPYLVTIPDILSKNHTLSISSHSPRNCTRSPHLAANQLAFANPIPKTSTVPSNTTNPSSTPLQQISGLRMMLKARGDFVSRTFTQSAEYPLNRWLVSSIGTFWTHSNSSLSTCSSFWKANGTQNKISSPFFNI